MAVNSSFICTGQAPCWLNGKHCVFGKVAEGLDLGAHNGSPMDPKWASLARDIITTVLLTVARCTVEQTALLSVTSMLMDTIDSIPL